MRSIVLLDSLGPISVTAESTTDRLRRSLVKNRLGVSRIRQFESIDEMAQARRAVSGLSEAAARLICERAAREVNGQYEWRSDPALNWVSSIVMTDEQALEFLEHVRAPVLTFTATEESPWSTRAKLEQRKQAISHGRHVTLQGHHHFHMDAPGEIAETIQNFIIENDQNVYRGRDERAN